MGGIFISCIYIYIVHSSPYLCVWQWSGNLLSGSRWCFRWARRRL